MGRKEDILGTWKQVPTENGVYDMVLKEHAFVAMDEYYNEAVDNCIEVVNNHISPIDPAFSLLLNKITEQLEQLKKPLQ